jgi:large subunit ribosomal protein L29
MELESKLNEAYRELFNLRFRLSTRQLVNYHEIGKLKKRIARIKTVMREIELSTEE